MVDIDLNGPSRERLFQNDVLVSVITSDGRKNLRSAQDLQQVLNGAREGSYLSLLVYNLDQDQTRIVNLRVGK